jgi:hypothetical protein
MNSSGSLLAQTSGQNLHPFPARMAPEIALARIADLPRGSTVLDPMTGSGTVVRTASQLGHRAIGFDLDPLAVLMSKVVTTTVNPNAIVDYGASIAAFCRSLSAREVILPWIDNDIETDRFVRFWFAPTQIRDLRKLAWFLNAAREERAPRQLMDALKLALSRIIITKTRGASLAWDVSHSRPHKVRDDNDYDVLSEFVVSCQTIAKRLTNAAPCTVPATIHLGDARCLDQLQRGSVDIVVTSPPYLNAIDYMRGHKLALVWLGYSIPELRKIRSVSIGTERRNNSLVADSNRARVMSSFGSLDSLPATLIGMAERYAGDLVALMQSMSGVVKRTGEIHMVVGDSRLRGVEISNSSATVAAAQVSGLALLSSTQRDIPRARRYLPISMSGDGRLSKRMLVEHVLSFRHA